jgi:hypothetical protein
MLLEERNQSDINQDSRNKLFTGIQIKSQVKYLTLQVPSVERARQKKIPF